MTGKLKHPTSFRIAIADPNWKEAGIVVADAHVLGGEIRIEPREGMHVEDEERLKVAITRGQKRFQAEGYSMREVCNLPSSAKLDDKTRANAWRYLIIPTDDESM